MKTRSNSQKNSNTDIVTQPTCSSTLTRRSNKTPDPKPQPKLAMDDSNLSEDEEPENTVMKDLKQSSSPTNSSTHTPSKQQNKQNVSCSSYSKYKYIFIVLIIIIICIGIGVGICLLPSFLNNHITTNDGNDVKSGPVDLLDSAMDVIDEMEKSFPLQETKTWTSFLSALTSVIEQEEPSQPAVLLFVGGNTLIETHTMQCVALTLANNTNKLLPKMNVDHAVSSLLSEITVQVDKFVTLQNQEAIKKELDNRMRSILNKSYSVVVGPLEKIPPDAALLLHGYCDNFEAPFKKRVIILTATFDSDKPLNSKQLERKLNTLWDLELGKEKSASIVSRIANNVVFIEPETDPIPCNILHLL